jgi:hypothetical protein
VSIIGCSKTCSFLLVYFEGPALLLHQKWRKIVLTYEDLAAAPARVDIPQTEYSHTSQMGSQSNAWPTINGTQTYNHNGQPSDSDQD